MLCVRATARSEFFSPKFAPLFVRSDFIFLSVKYVNAKNFCAVKR